MNCKNWKVNMRVLFIYTDDFPNRGACTSLLNNLLFEGKMIDKLEKIDVMTVKYQFDQKENEVYKNVGIHRVLVWSYIFSDEIRRNLKIKPITTAVAIISKKYIRLKNRVCPQKYLDSITIKQLISGLEKINAQQYDVIVAVAGDFHTIEAVRQYSRRPHSPHYIIYQVDPCSTNYLAAPATKKNRIKFEEQAYKQATLVMTTPIICKEAAENYQNRYKSKFVEIEFPNVSNRYSSDTEKNIREDEKIRCLFTGNIYSGIRDPKYTLELFQRLTNPRIEFVLVGANKIQTLDKDNGGQISLLGARSLNETRKIISDADILVNIGNAMQNQVPSKLFEYISTGKPIVNIYKNQDCPTLHYLEKYPYVLNLFEDMKDIDSQVKMLETFILDNYKKRGDISKIMHTYIQCTPQYCANQMVDAFHMLFNKTV